MDSRVVYQKGKPQGNRRNLEEHDVSEYDENEHEHNLDGADVVYDEEIDPRDSNLKEQPGRGSGRYQTDDSRSVPREDGNKYSSNGQVSNNQNSRLKKPNDFIISSKAKKNGIKTIEELKVGKPLILETALHQQQRDEEEVQRYISRECPAEDQAISDEERDR